MPDVPTAAAEGLLHPTTGATHVLSGKMGIRLCLLRGSIEENGHWVVFVLSRKTDIGSCCPVEENGHWVVFVLSKKMGIWDSYFWYMCVVCTMYLRVRVCDVCKCVCVHARVCVSSFIQIKSKVTAGNVKYLRRGGQIS